MAIRCSSSPPTGKRGVGRPAQQVLARPTAREDNETYRQHHLLRGCRKASVSRSAIDSGFERALSTEIAASELLRMRVVAATLGVLLVADQLLLLFARDLVEQFYQKPIPAWVPTRIIGPFLAYEIVALLVLPLPPCGWKHRPNRGEVRQRAH